ncbi:MAG: CoA-binding protein [Nanoarchaeota archaeon]
MEAAEIKKILEDCRTIAVIGCSSNPEKAANRIPKYMQEHGYKIFPVNPNSENILNEKTYKSLSDVKEKADIVDIFRPSEECLEVVKEAIKIKPKVIWMQLGIISEEAKKLAEKNEIKVVMDKCIMIEHKRLNDKLGLELGDAKN